MAIGVALQQREAANPRFAFLQPGHAHHAGWRSAVADGLGAETAAQLLPPLPAAADLAHAAMYAAAPPAAAASAGGGGGAEGVRAAPLAAVAANAAQLPTAAERAVSAAEPPAAAAVDAASTQPGANWQPAADVAADADAELGTEAGASDEQSPATVSSGSFGAVAAAARPAKPKVMRAHYAAPVQAAASASVGQLADGKLAVPAAAAAAGKPVAAIRSNPQLAQRIVGPLPPPKPKAAVSTSAYASALAESGAFDAAAAAAEALAAAAAAQVPAVTNLTDLTQPAKKPSSPPPWLAARDATGRLSAGCLLPFTADQRPIGCCAQCLEFRKAQTASEDVSAWQECIPVLVWFPCVLTITSLLMQAAAATAPGLQLTKRP